LEKLPECERIGDAFYKLNTLDALKALNVKTEQSIGRVQARACSLVDGIVDIASPGIEAYLDWYFSLGADMTRAAAMLTGNLDHLLESQFNQLVFQDDRLRVGLAAIQQGYSAQWSQAVARYGKALSLMARNRLVLSDQQCRVVRTAEVSPALSQFEAHRTRLVGSAATGLVAGTFAAAVTGKAVGKATMKAASKALGKLFAKNVVTKGGAAAAGAAVGTLVAPGVGTAAGALVGAGIGLLFGVTVDMAALAAEEHFNRDQMRQELRAAVQEQVQEARKFTGCTQP
jgi:hypothetical protein